MVSFDIVNLFTNVAVPDVLLSVRSRLSSSDLPDGVAGELYTLLELALQQNFFKFNDKIFRQTSGLAMGCPLSPILAEIFLADLELKLSNHTMFRSKIKFWRRYVDDVFSIFEGNDTDVADFLNYLNDLHPQVKFTYELENQGSLPFLDIIISNVDRKLSFEVYRKPTTTSHVIPFHSQHPISHKLSSFNSFFFRLLRLPLSPDAFEKELTTIHRIAFENGYPDGVIRKVFERCKRKVFLERLTSLTVEKTKCNGYFSVPYIQHLSDRLKHIFSKYDLQLSSSVRGTLRSILSTGSSRADPFSKSGVYRLACSCGKCYVGRTFRNFRTRYSEHVRYLKSDKSYDMDMVRARSTFAHHVLVNKCHYNSDVKCIEVLHTNCNNSTIAQLESLEILSHKIAQPDRILNDVIDFDNDIILSKLLSIKDLPLAPRDIPPRHFHLNSI